MVPKMTLYPLSIDICTSVNPVNPGSDGRLANLERMQVGLSGVKTCGGGLVFASFYKEHSPVTCIVFDVVLLLSDVTLHLRTFRSLHV
jgi:hypothetical protein